MAKSVIEADDPIVDLLNELTRWSERVGVAAHKATKAHGGTEPQEYVAKRLREAESAATCRRNARAALLKAFRGRLEEVYAAGVEDGRRSVEGRRP